MDGFRSTGRENDGTGLYFYRSRYYSPTLQRFISEDPIGMLGSGQNLYAYVGNSPISFVDPLGLDKQGHTIPWNRVAAVSGGLGNVALGGVKVALGLGAATTTGGLGTVVGAYAAYSGLTNIAGGISQIYGGVSGNLAAGNQGANVASSFSTPLGALTYAATGNAETGATVSNIEGIAEVGLTGGLTSTGALTAPGGKDIVTTIIDAGQSVVCLSIACQ